MNVDTRLLAGMIAAGITAAADHLEEPFEVTINEGGGTVYVRTRDRRFFRVEVRELYPSQALHEERRDGASQ
jgi:hypothetical protein